MHSTNRLLEFINRHAVLFLSGLVALLVAALYLSIAATRLTDVNFGSDGGDFLAAVLTRGIPHPTGYPTYILLGILFQSLPFNTPVFRGVLESLLPAALAAGLLTGWTGHLFGSKTAPHLFGAAVAGIAWGVAPLLFSQAVIVEVHGLQSLIGALLLWWITFNLQAGAGISTKWILGLSFLAGLGLGNHIMGLFFIPVILFEWIYLIQRKGSWKLVLAQVALMLAGTLVYLYLPLRARAFPPLNWGNPQSWSGFVWEISGNPYRGLLFGTHTPVLWERIRSVFSLIMDQFGAIGLVAGVLGIIQYSFSTRWIRWILVWIFVVYFTFAIGYDTLDSVDYLLPAIMVFAIWIGLSIPLLWSVKWKRLPLGLILVSVVIISIGVRIPGTIIRVDPRQHDQPARYAEQFLKEAPPGAIVYTTTDGDTFPLWYYHFGLHERPDLRVITLPLTQFVWYQQTLTHNYLDLAYPRLYSEDSPNVDWGEQIADLNPDRPVCRTQLSAEAETGIAYQCTNP